VPRRGAHGAVRDLWKSNGSGKSEEKEDENEEADEYIKVKQVHEDKTKENLCWARGRSPLLQRTVSHTKHSRRTAAEDAVAAVLTGFDLQEYSNT